MVRPAFAAGFLVLIAVPVAAQHGECWVGGEFEGRSATSFESYAFEEDAFAEGMLICFTEDGGLVTGSDLQFVRLGPSTLIGWGQNDQGLETVNTFQIDRVNNKLLITQSRVGTATVTSALPDYAASFVGDAARVD